MASTHNKTILVTGASGHIAAWIIRTFLEHGYTVIGTVRSEDKAEAVRNSHPKEYADKLQFRIVADIAQPGAFDKAVKDVDGVIHTASPFNWSPEDNERDLLIPAIHGTTELLKSIKNQNPSVKRVVITASFAGMMDVSKGLWPGHVYTDQDWNPATYEQAKHATGEFRGPFVYMASKKLAEIAAWAFVEQEKPNFSVTTICPSGVYGPLAKPVSKLGMEDLGYSISDIYRFVNGSVKEVPPTQFCAWVDVRDVAEAHRLAFEKEEAGDQRYLVSAGPYSYQDVCDAIRKNFPELREKVPEGKPGDGIGGVEHYTLDNSKSKELGVSYISWEQCMVDTTKSLLELEKRVVGK